LVSLGLVDMGTTPVASPPVAKSEIAPTPTVAAAAPEAAAPSGIDFNTALHSAITLCANLGFKGFGLNMALADTDSLAKLQKLAPEIRRAAGDAKYKPLHELIFGKPL
jgi:hypothetical protein